MVEIMGEGSAVYNGGEGLSDEEKDGVKDCIDSILSIIQLLMSSEKLTVSKEGRSLLCAILKQLANGEKKPRASGASQISDDGTPIFFITSLKSLFDLVEEVCMYPQRNDLSYTMKVVNSLESIIGCSQRLIDALIAPCQQLEAVAGEVRKIAMGCSQKLSELAFKSLKLDWCPPELRAHRNKFSYNKGNVGVLVKIYLDHSGVDKILIDTKIPGEVIAMDVAGIGKIAAIKNLAENIIPGLADTEGCKGPVLTYPTLTGQSLGNYFGVVMNALSIELDRLFGYKMIENDECVSVVMKAIASLIGAFRAMCDLVKQVRGRDSHSFVKFQFLTPSKLPMQNEGFQKKPILLAQIKGGCRFIEVYVKLVLPYFGKHFELWKDDILNLIKELQYCTRSLQNVASWGKRKNELSVVKESPKLKKILEVFIYQVRARHEATTNKAQ